MGFAHKNAKPDIICYIFPTVNDIYSPLVELFLESLVAVNILIAIKKVIKCFQALPVVLTSGLNLT